ncbi:MAG: MBL fold metallo-hydrolase [Prevotellaceae bacterium]|nr:MBL fold metallo-hydrolase [Candidatus Minthosoma caballi]
MRITSIIENTSNKGLSVEHGLSLYIEKDSGQKVLFDMGQSGMFVRNAESLGLSIADVDVAVISHGHYDHGGGLKTFFQANKKASVYIHMDAFLPHYSLRDTRLRFIGIDNDFANHERLILCDKQTDIDDNMMLFANVQGNCCYPFGNRLLFGPAETENDDFSHEQNLLIEEGEKLVLFAGCAHRGIVNILRKAEEIVGKTPTHVFAGMHLVKSGLPQMEEDEFIESLASELMKYRNTMFYTMHCTGEEQYNKLKSFMGRQIEYMACGDSMELFQK